MIARLYWALTGLATPFIITFLMARRRRGKEHPVRFTERFGYASAARPTGKMVWFHAASVGEAISIIPVLNDVRSTTPDSKVLVTTGTVTSAEIVAQRYPADVIHQFAPVDLPQAVRRFLDHWRPDAAVWVESELWPNMVLKTHGAGIPMALINGRLSKRAARSWQQMPGLAAAMASAFDVCLAQSQVDADRFRAMGFKNVKPIGNLKTVADPLPVDELHAERLLDQIGARPVWLALSIHPGEDQAVVTAHRHVCRHHPNALCLVVPRHPPKAPAMQETFETAGMKTARRSGHDTIQLETQIYLADTMGETGTMMALASVAFVGKSIGVQGGQNPVEPARQGLAIVFGPHMENFENIAADMIASKAAIQVSDADALGATVSQLLDDNTDAVAAAATFVHQDRDVVADTIAIIAGLTEQPDGVS